MQQTAPLHDPNLDRIRMAGSFPDCPLTILGGFQPVRCHLLKLASCESRIAASTENASLIVKTMGPQTPPVQIGSARVSSTGAVDGFAIFHHVITQQETVVPLETRNAGSYLLAFDNTGGSVLGIALAMIGQPMGSIRIVIRDDTGVVAETQPTWKD
jgi:hypothetical protein